MDIFDILGPVMVGPSSSHTAGAARMIVSRGLGNSIIPLRVNNRPELVVAELSRGERP